MTFRAWLAALGLCLIALPARAEVKLAPASDGYLGAWLVAGPATSAAAGDGAANAELNAALGGRGLRFKLIAKGDGAIDLIEELGVGKSAGPYAWAGGALELAQPLRGWLLVAADGGIKVTVDGRTLLDRDVPKLRDASFDVLPLDLEAGRHPLLIRLHHTGEHWAFTARVLERATLLPPRGLSLVLAGTSDADAERLAGTLLTTSLETGGGSSGYRPKINLEYRRGAPRGIPLDATVTLSGLPGGPRTARLGRVPVTERGVHAASAELHSIAPDTLAAGAPRRMTLALKVGPARLERALVLAQESAALLARAEKLERALPKGLLDAEVVKATLELRARRVARVGAGKRASVASVERAVARLKTLLEALERGDDPLVQPGLLALGRRSDLDDRPQRVLIHVPRGFRRDGAERYPLVVLLHGYNGSPRSVMRAFLDTDSTAPVAKVDGFIVAPHAHGNAFYRGPGEREVMAVLDWMLKTYPIDPERVSISGVSMGGTGTAHMALRYADRFAAAAPLCGYQSFFVRKDTAERPIRPWENDQMRHWSPASWAENGRQLPLHVAHGTKDFPLENSKVLIERYRELGYSVVQEWPDTGHAVWERAYADARLWPFLTQKRIDPEPRELSLKTDSLRYGRRRWLTLTQLERPGHMGEIQARVSARDLIEVVTRGVRGLKLERPARHVASDAPLRLTIDQSSLTFAPTEPLEVFRDGAAWKKGAPPATPLNKHAHLEGAIRDAYLERVAFVWGSRDPATARANREVAEWLARLRYGADLAYPVLPDSDADARLESERALLLVGSPRDHRLLAELEQKLPVRVAADGLTLGAASFRGDEVGAIYVYPNPRSPGRYVVAVTATTARGIWRALSLPQLLPDFVVFDAGLAPAAGQQVLGAASVLAAGFFENDWSVPKELADVKTSRDDGKSPR